MTNEKIEKKFLFDLNMDVFKVFPTDKTEWYFFRCDRNILKLMKLLDNNGFSHEYVMEYITYTKRDLRNFSRNYIISINRDYNTYRITEYQRYLKIYCNEIPNYIKRYDMNKKEDEND